MSSYDSGGTMDSGDVAEKNVCLVRSCTVCCRGTAMALSNEDVRRIESLGYAKEYFVKESKGLMVLKNFRHLCVFHDGTRCTIYQERPTGCRLYPVVYAEYSGTTVMDRTCPFRDEFHSSPESRRESIGLYHKLIEEARQRKKARLSKPERPKNRVRISQET